jgi:hypothetical protein
MLRKTSAAAAVIAFATAGSALFGGVALADEVTNTGGAGGAGGVAENNCLNLAVQVPILNAFGSDPSNAASCTATANGGAGGDASIGR